MQTHTKALSMQFDHMQKFMDFKDKDTVYVYEIILPAIHEIISPATERLSYQQYTWHTIQPKNPVVLCMWLHPSWQ